MELLNQYGEQIANMLQWLSNPETTIPVVKLLQGLAAVVGALISSLGFYKAWRYAESKLGERLSEFLAKEESKLEAARRAARDIQQSKPAVKQDLPTIFSNRELHGALKHVRKGRLPSAEALLSESLAKCQDRENKAHAKARLHGRQRAVANLLLGAIADQRRDHQKALAYFQAAHEFDEHDLEAQEYVGLQHLKLGNSIQALVEFSKLAAAADSAGNFAAKARALRYCGRAHEALPTPSYYNANVAYRDAIQAFPEGSSILDVAYVHELRGKANIKLKNRIQANSSLMNALTRYSSLGQAKNSSAGDAKEGVKRIHEALSELQQLVTSPQLPNGGTVVAPPPQSN